MSLYHYYIYNKSINLNYDLNQFVKETNTKVPKKPNFLDQENTHLDNFYQLDIFLKWRTSERTQTTIGMRFVAS